MILELSLQHVKDKRFQKHEIWDVPAEKIMALLQMPKTLKVDTHGKVVVKNEYLEKYVSKLIDSRLPSYLFNFQVLDWEFKDHRAAHDVETAR